MKREREIKKQEDIFEGINFKKKIKMKYVNEQGHSHFFDIINIYVV